MNLPPDPPHDTQEFLAQWNAATEAHLTDKLTEILQQLAVGPTGEPSGSSDLFAALAPHVLHALQVAANPGATVHDAIDYLSAIAERSSRG